jgi:hypothetical protein
MEKAFAVSQPLSGKGELERVRTTRQAEKWFSCLLLLSAKHALEPEQQQFDRALSESVGLHTVCQSLSHVR